MKMKMMGGVAIGVEIKEIAGGWPEVKVDVNVRGTVREREV